MSGSEDIGALEASDRAVVLFVAMSFREDQEPALVDYYYAIRRAVAGTRLPIVVERMDNVEGDYEISSEIMSRIEESDIVLGDFTLEPRNVYFELGFARGCGRRIIQTARTGTNLEFDVKTWRTIFYRNATELESKLGDAITAAYHDVEGRRA